MVVADRHLKRPTQFLNIRRSILGMQPLRRQPVHLIRELAVGKFRTHVCDFFAIGFVGLYDVGLHHMHVAQRQGIERSVVFDWRRACPGPGSH